MLKIGTIGTDTSCSAITPGQLLRAAAADYRPAKRGNMDIVGQATKLRVLARVPDLGTSEREITRGSVPPSSGRVIGQVFSFQVLAAVTLLLVVMATVPFILNREGTPTNQLTTADPLPAWQQEPPAASGDAAGWTVSVANVLPSPPTVASPSPMKAAVSPLAVIGDSPASAPTGAPLMSEWPNPANPPTQSEADGEEPRTGVNQAMAIRPSEYIRSSHDRTGSSVH
jgi:hypothetical protein